MPSNGRKSKKDAFTRKLEEALKLVAGHLGPKYCITGARVESKVPDTDESSSEEEPPSETGFTMSPFESESNASFVYELNVPDCKTKKKSKSTKETTTDDSSGSSASTEDTEDSDSTDSSSSEDEDDEGNDKIKRKCPCHIGKSKKSSNNVKRSTFKGEISSATDGCATSKCNCASKKNIGVGTRACPCVKPGDDANDADAEIEDDTENSTEESSDCVDEKDQRTACLTITQKTDCMKRGCLKGMTPSSFSNQFKPATLRSPCSCTQKIEQSAATAKTRARKVPRKPKGAFANADEEECNINDYGMIPKKSCPKSPRPRSPWLGLTKQDLLYPHITQADRNSFSSNKRQQLFKMCKPKAFRKNDARCDLSVCGVQTPRCPDLMSCAATQSLPAASKRQSKPSCECAKSASNCPSKLARAFP